MAIGNEEYMPPEAFVAELPNGMSLPDGILIDESAPRMRGFRQLASELHLSQEQFSGLLGFEVQCAMAHAEMIKSAIADRDKALGENGTARVDALAKWIDTVVTDPKEAAQVKATLWTPVIIEFYERARDAMAAQHFSLDTKADHRAKLPCQPTPALIGGGSL